MGNWDALSGFHPVHLTGEMIYDKTTLAVKQGSAEETEYSAD